MNIRDPRTPPSSSTETDARFDAAMRALHHDGVRSVSPSVRWKLKPMPATGRQSPAPLRDWRMGSLFAGAAAAVFALAIGLNLGDAPKGAVPATDTIAATGPAGTLEQDPDFYAWLASSDADLMAME